MKKIYNHEHELLTDLIIDNKYEKVDIYAKSFNKVWIKKV
jgi:hypothetical protein